MNVYVESNFVLELALLQDQHESCDKILSICEAGRARLILPAFCIAEPYETLGRHEKHRKNLATDVASELGQLLRSEPYKEEVESLQNVKNILIRSNEEEKQRLNRTLDRILKVAEVIPLDREILVAAVDYQVKLDLGPQDSIVYASVIHHLDETTEPQKCFLNRNSKDFDDPDVVETLDGYSCKMIPRFDDGYNYIQSQVRSKG